MTKLEKLDIRDCDLQSFMAFTDKYHNYIKDMNLHIYNDINSYLTQISRFLRLQKLNINFNKTSNSVNENIKKAFLTIEKSCSQLTQFTIDMYIEINDFNNSIFQILEGFQNLQKLIINIPFIACAKNGSIASFKNLKN